MSATWLGVKRIKLSTIGLPGGFARRKKESHVHALAASIKGQGVISLPVIDAKTRKLVAGGDRLAALMLNGVTLHEVRLVEGTPAELEAIALAENVWRRRGDDYDSMVRRLVELAELPVKPTDKSDEDTEPVKPGRPQTPRGAAREEVAAQLGATPEAVRQAEKRAAQKERVKEEPVTPVPPITTYGVPLPPDLVRAIVSVQERIDEASRLLRAAQREITVLGEQGSLGGPIAAHVRAAVRMALEMVKRERPDGICPACKFLPRRFDCMMCGGSGVVSNDKLAACAPELLLSGDEAVVPDGRGGFVSYAVAADREGPLKTVARPAVKDDAADDEDVPF